MFRRFPGDACAASMATGGAAEKAARPGPTAQARPCARLPRAASRPPARDRFPVGSQHVNTRRTASQRASTRPVPGGPVRPRGAPPGGAGRPGPRRPRAFRWCPATLPINAKSPPPFAGKRALCIYDSQAFSARNFSSGSISMLSSGMGSDFMRLRPRNSLAAMAAKISAKPLVILTVIASL